jgi:hypothetical protein
LATLFFALNLTHIHPESDNIKRLCCTLNRSIAALSPTLFKDPDSVSSAASRAKELLESPRGGGGGGGGRGGLHLLCHTAGLL